MKRKTHIINIMTSLLIVSSGFMAQAQGEASTFPENQLSDNPTWSIVSSSIRDTGDVLHSIIAPGTMCQGLTWADGYIWVSDNESKTIYKLDPEDGSIISYFEYPVLINFVEGLAFDGTSLYATGWKESNGTGSKLFKLDPEDGSTLESHTYPGDKPWPHGLTWDGQYLWSANFIYEELNTFDKLDPATAQILEQHTCQSGETIGMAWDGNSLWSNDFKLHKLFEIDPFNFAIQLEAPSPCGNPRDMAWDGEFLWVVCWQNATIYQLTVGPASTFTEQQKSLTIYPNPVSPGEDISLTVNTNTNACVRIINSKGSLMNKSGILKLKAGEKTSIKNLFMSAQKGLYLIQIMNDDQRILASEKLIIR